jgi:hypothetical protein
VWWLDRRPLVLGCEWPGGKAPFGYRLDTENKTLQVEPTEAAVVAEVARRLLSGEGVLAITRDFVAQGHAEVNRATASPTRSRAWSSRPRWRGCGSATA